MKVLIADDNPNHRSDMVYVVSEKFPNAEIIEAANFAEAMAAVEGGPDLLIVDARLDGDDPGLAYQGMIVAHKGRSINPKVSVVLVSALFVNPTDQARQQGFIIIDKEPGWLERLENILTCIMKNRQVLVFISYAQADYDHVRTLYDELEKGLTIKPWMDRMDMPPGVNWEKTIEKMIKKSDYFLACLSINYFDRKGMIQKELRWALDKSMEFPSDQAYLIPVKIVPCDIPEDLNHLEALKLYHADGMPRLMGVLKY